MKKYLIAIIYTLFICQGNAQIVSNDVILSKKKTVYIIMPDTTSKISRKYMEIYEKYWTFSQISFISPEEKEELSVPGNFFFGFICTNSNNVNLELSEYVKSADGTNKKSYVEIVDLIIKGFVKNRGYFDSILYGPKGDNISGIAGSPYDMGGNLISWGPGVLKNYIQKIGLLTSKDRSKLEDVSKYYPYATKVDDGTLMASLKTSDLYFTESCLMHYNKMYNYYTNKPKDDKKLLKKYRYPYEVVSDKELNKKILESKTEFFYCLFYFINGTKCVNIVSSKTGKVIFSTLNLNVYEFNKKDIKRILKKIKSS